MSRLMLSLNRTTLILFSYVLKKPINLTKVQFFYGITTQCSICNVNVYIPQKILKADTVNTLQELLQLDKISATKIATNSKKLLGAAHSLIKENYDICKLYGISNESILNCPEILSYKDLSEKLGVLSELSNININEMVGLLKVNKKEVEDILYYLKKGSNRIKYFSELLEVSPLEICEHIITKSFLRNINLDRAKEAVQLLREHGITNHEILSDLWALNYSRQTIEKRINFVKENNLEKVKTWMIRAQPHILLNYIKIRSDNKSILGNNSLTEYLSNRLECPVEHANYIITKFPALKTKSVKKMDEIIDYLYDQGFKPIQICIMPKILLHSVETMKKRVFELEQYGVAVDNLNLLTKSQKQYAIYYSRLVRSNKKKLKKQ